MGNSSDDVVFCVTLTDVPPGFEHGLDDAVAAGTLSSLQMESIIYASVKHEQRLRGGQRAGFFLGDGPGVGKGRQIAGLVSFSLFSYCMGNYNVDVVFSLSFIGVFSRQARRAKGAVDLSQRGPQVRRRARLTRPRHRTASRPRVSQG